MKRKLFTIFFILIIVVCNTMNAYGLDISEITGSTTPINDEAIKIRDRVLAVAESIGVIVVVCMLVFLAIKYFTSAPNDRADLKKYAIIFLIGATLIFGAIGVAEFFKTFADEISNVI